MNDEQVLEWCTFSPLLEMGVAFKMQVFAASISNSISVSFSTTDILNFCAISFKVFCYVYNAKWTIPSILMQTLCDIIIIIIIIIFLTSYLFLKLPELHVYMGNIREMQRIIESTYKRKKKYNKNFLFIQYASFHVVISLVEWNVRCKNPFIFHLKYQLARTAPILFFNSGCFFLYIHFHRNGWIGCTFSYNQVWIT